MRDRAVFAGLCLFTALVGAGVLYEAIRYHLDLVKRVGWLNSLIDPMLWDEETSRRFAEHKDSEPID